MTRPPKRLPEFDRPPVVETVLGLSFLPLQGWDARHFGLFWRALQPDFPGFKVQPPLLPGEVPKQGQVAQQLVVQLLAQPKFRAWFIDETRTRLVQVQDDWFLSNWRKVGNAPYPRYSRTRPNFAEQWERFLQFLDEQRIPRPSLKSWEVSYINHFERGFEWLVPPDVEKILHVRLPAVTLEGLQGPRDLSFQMSYSIPGLPGRLEVSLEPGTRNRDKKEIVQLTIKARGSADTTDEADILRWLDAGREWVVTTFAELTTPEMHQLWGRTDR